MNQNLYSLIKAKSVRGLPSDEMKLIYVYRYLSLLLTSLIYLTDKYKAPMADKFAVIGFLTIAVILLNYIYSKNGNEISIVKVLIMIESIGSILILIPTGGLSSPYIWYSLNTVLATAYYLSLRYFCLIIASYAVFSVVISLAVFNISGGKFINYLLDNSNLVLSYILIVIAIQSMMRLAKRMREESNKLFLANNELEKANRTIEKSMEINKRFLIVEEQNRIANEIHDSVSQRLFYISTRLHSLSQGVEEKKTVSIKNELNLLLSSLTGAMKELREAIYSYSYKKSGKDMFEEKIRSYLNEISELNDVNIKFDVKGSMEIISCELKKVLYRILCEALGNAIRHGKSRNIDIRLAVDSGNINLEINDDGTGFDLKNKSNMGMGIRNLYNLAHSNGGEIAIKSQFREGTRISIELPPETIINQERGKVI